MYFKYASMILALLLLAPRFAFAHHPCATLACKSIQECKDSAGWVIEGTLADVVHMGHSQECETNMMDPAHPLCGHVVRPELLILKNATVAKGAFNIGEQGAAVTSRKDTCFSGALSVGNTKPELRALGQKVRIFGSDERIPPFIQPGYFFVEMIGAGD